MNDRHKQIQHIKKKYKHLTAAAAVVGAVLFSSAALPGIPASIAHAAVNPNVSNASQVISYQRIASNQLNKPIQVNYNIANTQAVKKFPIKNPNQSVNRIQSNDVKNHKVTTPKQANAMPNASTNLTSDPLAQLNSNVKTPDKPTANFKQAIDMVATAYAPGSHDNDQWGDKTYMGTTVRPGVIAVDPKIIPLGSRVYIQYPDGHGEYALAEDTGGAIKGNRIDIAMRSDDKANGFGIQNVKVYVLSKSQNT